MKNLTVLSLFLTAQLSFCFADTEKPVNVPIKNVTVYLNGAEINRLGNTTLVPGTSTLVFEGLSRYIDKNSIQVGGKGNFTILSVKHQLNFLSEAPKPKEITDLESELESLTSKIEYEEGMQGVYKDEANMMRANQSIGNKDVGVDAVDLEEIANLFRKRLSELNGLNLQSRAAVKDMKEKKNQISQQLRSLNTKRNSSTSEVLVRVKAKERTPAKLELSYYVGNAGWIPSYDLRVEDTEKPVKLTQKSKVWQRTEADWNNVLLTLSTANPMREGTKPTLYPWRLRYLTVNRYKSASRSYKEQGAPMNAPAALGIPELDDNSNFKEESAGSASKYTSVRENTISTEYKVNAPYNIPSDGKEHDVHIQDHSLLATFEHFTVPKMDRDAFLVGRVTGWEDFNLLAGEANLYFEGGYVGKSHINPQITTDTLDLSLGRDKGVVVIREKVKEFSSSKLIGTNKREVFAYDISVRNTKKEVVNISVEDQVPLSKNKEVEVTIDDLSAGKLDPVTGKVSWKLSLQPAETQKIRLIYTVKYPKDKKLANL